MSADDIIWGRGGGRRVPKGTRAGEALADIEALRQQLGGDLRAKPVAADDGQLDLFACDGPPPAGDERES